MKWFLKRNFAPIMMIVIFTPSLLEVGVSKSWSRYIAIIVIITLLFLIIYSELKRKKAP